MESVNWQDKYIDKLSADMDSIKQDIRDLRGMESRISAQLSEDVREIRANINESNRHTQSLLVAIVIGIGAIVMAVWLK